MISEANTGPWPAQSKVIPVGPRKKFATVILGCLAALFRAVNAGKGLARPFEKKAIILEPYGMGDVISLLPLLEELKKSQWEVTVLAKTFWRPVASPDLYRRWISTMLPWASYHDGEKYASLSALRSCILKLKSELGNAHEFVGIDPRGDIRSVLLLYWLGCREVVSLSTYVGSDARLPSFAVKSASAGNGLHRWRQILNLLPLLQIPLSGVYEQPRITAHSETSPKKRSIGLLPIAPWAGKFWGAEKWKELYDKLVKEGFCVTGYCGPGQAAAVREIFGEGVPITNCESIDDWIARLGEMELLVTVDSGPMHLASALGIPTVSLFGVSPLPLWAPSGARSKVIHHQDEASFSLCHQVEMNTPLGRSWMDRIEVGEVLAACHQVLSRSTSA